MRPFDRPVLGLLLRTCALLFALLPAVGLGDDFQQQRQEMVVRIVAIGREAGADDGGDTLDAGTLAVMERVPRHRFVSADLQRQAYQNRPLPIGFGQTISQPYIVALMTALLRPRKGDVVLELGTGSGYQAAILAEMVKSVHTIEIIEPLGAQARERLQALGYANVEVRTGDGYHGWVERAPFDAIVVTAAASHIPPPLIRQLKPGGRMVIPVGAQFMVQHLMLVEKRQDGSLVSRQITPVRFVPLTGGH